MRSKRSMPPALTIEIPPGLIASEVAAIASATVADAATAASYMVCAFANAK